MRDSPSPKYQPWASSILHTHGGSNSYQKSMRTAPSPPRSSRPAPNDRTANRPTSAAERGYASPSRRILRQRSPMALLVGGDLLVKGAHAPLQRLGSRDQ